MNIFAIVLISVWVYPFIGYLIYRFTINRLAIRKKILIALVSLNTITILGILTGISTTSIVVDWLFISSFYLTLGTLLWIGQDHKYTIVKVFSIVCMSFVFLLGFLGGSIGALGTAFILGGYDPKVTKKISKDIIYKETPLGNAIADYRGKRVEIFKTISWMPLIEWRTHKKEYYIIETYMNELTVKYAPNERTIYLSAPTVSFNKLDSTTANWSDIISLQ